VQFGYGAYINGAPSCRVSAERAPGGFGVARL
jgi:hypothetical protein